MLIPVKPRTLNKFLNESKDEDLKKEKQLTSIKQCYILGLGLGLGCRPYKTIKKINECTASMVRSSTSRSTL